MSSPILLRDTEELTRDQDWRPSPDALLEVRISWDREEHCPFIQWRMKPPGEGYQLRGYRSEEGFVPDDPLQGGEDFGNLFLESPQLQHYAHDPLPFKTGATYFYMFFMERRNPNYSPDATSLERFFDSTVTLFKPNWVPSHKAFHRIGVIRLAVPIRKTKSQRERVAWQEETDTFKVIRENLEERERIKILIGRLDLPEEVLGRLGIEKPKAPPPRPPRKSPLEQIHEVISESQEALAGLKEAGLTEDDPIYRQIERGYRSRIRALSEQNR